MRNKNMMRICSHFRVVTIILFFASNLIAQEKHFITDPAYQQQVHSQFLLTKDLTKNREKPLFDIFKKGINREQKEALEFLYAYMPLSDLAMHNGDYIFSQVLTTLDARSFFSWGKTVPENIFRHFVLPYRINNEYTDSARQVFYSELKERIKGMSMYDAALEVNHWCHEKVSYKGSDERTSGPLTTVRNALGRCGEESTFTVAALRSVCLPARQVYTPRWAHTDDNHAWVEVWVDGKWYFLGACEPDYELNMGWFAGPVKRAMMTHTVVFGQYQGSEEKLQKDDRFTRVNLLSNYASTKTIPVRVTYNGKAAENAKVEFMLYNYAEFYPIATKYTDKKGVCSSVTGYGDLIVWASLNGAFGFLKVNGVSVDTITIAINQLQEKSYVETFNLVPPIVQTVSPGDNAKQQANNIRLQNEDLIRNKYTSTFIDSASICKLASKKGLKCNQIYPFLINSRGNWKEIYSFIESLSLKDTANGFAILRNISEKDLHDVSASTLNDHIQHLYKQSKGKPLSWELFEKYVLSPRIGSEFVTTWRSYLQKAFGSKYSKSFESDPATIVSWISKNIKLDNQTNYYNVPISPEGVFELRVADNISRNIFFVAVCRSFGIASRLEPTTRKPQYLKGEQWIDVLFEKQITTELPKGSIVLLNKADDKNFIPQYYTHYTIARFNNGQFTTLDYETDQSLKTFPCTLSIDTGYYRLMTGNRLNDGSVKCRIEYFKVEKDKKIEVPVIVLPIEAQTGVLGMAELTAGFKFLDESEYQINCFLKKNGLVVVVIDPDKEPTKHLMEDIQLVKNGFDQWGGPVLFIIAKDKLSKVFDPAVYKKLPANCFFGYDPTGDVTNAIDLMCGQNLGAQFPQVSILNAKGEIVFYSEGYSIGMGETILKNLK